MRPILEQHRFTSSRARASLALTTVLVLVFGVLSSLPASASHPIPALPLEENQVKGLSDCNTGGVSGTAPQAGIPTGQVGNATTPPDRNNGSSSNEQIAGTKEALVIHANADNDGVPALGSGSPKELTLDISGSFNVFDGELDSRSHAKVGGSWNLFRHGFEYGQRTQTSAGPPPTFHDKPAFDLGGSDNCFSPPPNQEYENAPVAPAGFPQQAKFDPDLDGNILEHFAPGTTPANNAIAHTGAISIDVNGDSVPDITEPAQPLGRYFVCGLSPLPAGARQAPGCSGTGASAIMDRNVQGQQLEFGLYFVTGRIKLSASNLNALVTMVSGQQLNVNGSFQGQGFSVFTPYTDATGVVPTGTSVVGTLLFASQWDNATSLSGPTFGNPGVNEGPSSSDSPNTGDLADDALKIEGSLSRFEGIIVATNGRTEVAGEKLDFRCPVMGDRVRVNGSKNYFNAAGCVPQPILTVSKTPDGGVAGTINVGSAAVFTITVTNGGTSSLNNVLLDDVLPSDGGLTWTLTSATKNPGGTNVAASCTTPLPSGTTLDCNFGTLLAGESVVVVVTSSATSSAQHCGDLPNGNGLLQNGTDTPGDPAGDAIADSDEIGPVNDPGEIIVACPDVTVLKTGNGTINAGATAQFTIDIINNGPGTTSLVTLDPDGGGPLTGDTLPNTGLTWAITSQGFEGDGFTGGSSCAVSASPEVLTCNIVNLSSAAANNVYRIVLQAATGADDCGTKPNTVVISATGDITANNNTSSDTITIRCGAIRIEKRSIKQEGDPPANPLVTDPTPLSTADNATFVITPNPKTGTGTLTVVDNGLNDEDTTYGEVCVSGVIPAAAPGYSIEETQAPAGYGLPSQATPPLSNTQNSGAVTAPGDCTSGAALVVFQDPPLGEITVGYNDGGSGETMATSIVCAPQGGSNLTAQGEGVDDDIPGYDQDSTFTVVAPNTFVCTIVVDP